MVTYSICYSMSGDYNYIDAHVHLLYILEIISCSNITWCQKCDRMVSLCKLPSPLFFMGNTIQNWRDFKEQLKWYLAGMEASENSD